MDGIPQDKFGVMYVNFDDIENNQDLEKESFDLIFANDAFMHSISKTKLVTEISKLLTKDGLLVFSDILKKSDGNEGNLKTLYGRLDLQSMATSEEYCKAMESAGLTKQEMFFETEQLIRHYGAVKYAA
jgi:predicted TPR repeat methyltransferase